MSMGESEPMQMKWKRFTKREAMLQSIFWKE